MNWNRCSRLLLAVALVVSLGAGTAGAISAASDDLPDRQRVGEEKRATFTLTDLYEDGTQEFTLRGTTELEEVSWTVRRVKLNGDTSSETYTGQSFEATVSSNENVERVEVVVAGTAPPVEEFSYDPPPRFEFASFEKVVGDNVNEVEGWQVQHHTRTSMEARESIDGAQAAVSEANSQQAAEQLDRAIRAYENEDFELAVDLAEDAEQSATSARQSSQRTQLLLYAGVGVLALVVVVAGVYYVRSNSGPGDPLG